MKLEMKGLGSQIKSLTESLTNRMTKWKSKHQSLKDKVEKLNHSVRQSDKCGNEGIL